MRSRRAGCPCETRSKKRRCAPCAEQFPLIQKLSALELCEARLSQERFVPLSVRVNEGWQVDEACTATAEINLPASAFTIVASPTFPPPWIVTKRGNAVAPHSGSSSVERSVRSLSRAPFGVSLSDASPSRLVTPEHAPPTVQAEFSGLLCRLLRRRARGLLRLVGRVGWSRRFATPIRAPLLA